MTSHNLGTQLSVLKSFGMAGFSTIDVDNERLAQEANNLIGDRYDNGMSRAPKRAKSMICLSSKPLDFSELPCAINSPNSDIVSSNPKPLLKSTGSFKIPLPPKRRVSFFVSNGEFEVTGQEKSKLDLMTSQASHGDNDRCISDIFLFQGSGNRSFKRSRSFCDLRFNSSISDSWREML